MPRPSCGEEFELLIYKLTLEFERVQQENASLIRDLVHLRKVSEGPHSCRTAASPRPIADDAAMQEHFKEHPPHQVKSTWRSKTDPPGKVGEAAPPVHTKTVSDGAVPDSRGSRRRSSAGKFWAEMEEEARLTLPPPDEGLGALKMTESYLLASTICKPGSGSHLVKLESAERPTEYCETETSMQACVSRTSSKQSAVASPRKCVSPRKKSPQRATSPQQRARSPPRESNSRKRMSSASAISSLGRVSRKSSRGEGLLAFRHGTTGTVVFGWPELFSRLDETGNGKLYVDDILRLLSRNKETCDYESVVCLLRELQGLNCYEKAEVGDGINGRTSVFSSVSARTPELGCASSDLTMNFRNFAQVMDETLPLDCFEPSAAVAAQCLKAVCERELGRPKIYCEAPAKRSKSQRHKKITKTMTFWLETLPTIVILLNSLVTGLTVDYPEYQGHWDIIENVFVAFYFAEFVVKNHLYGCRGYFTGPDRRWNWFDFVCLLLSLTDTLLQVCVALFYTEGEGPDLSGLLLIKIFRLARLARLLRTLRFKIFSQLKNMVMGVFSGLRVLTWAIVLLVLLTYLVGVAMTNMVGKEEQEFSSVLSSMFTLFRCWTDGCSAYDGTPLAERLVHGRDRHVGLFFMAFHVLMTMFVTVGVFNLIMAIFIDNVVTSQLSRKLKEMGARTKEIELRFKKLFVNYVKNGIQTKRQTSIVATARQTLHSIITDGASMLGDSTHHMSWSHTNCAWEKLRNMNVTITRDVFRGWLEDREFQVLLEEADIESSNQAELFDVLDADMGGELSMDELTTGLMHLRGPVTKADMVAMKLKMRYLTKLVESFAQHSVGPAQDFPPSQGED